MNDVLLTLIAPLRIAEAVEDLMLAHPELVSGFTACPADGHGSPTHLIHAEERVAGHAPRVMILTAGTAADVENLLSLLKDRLPHAHLYYWVTPILARGNI